MHTYVRIRQSTGHFCIWVALNRRMEVKLPALLGNYDRQTDRPTDQPAERRVDRSSRRANYHKGRDYGHKDRVICGGRFAPKQYTCIILELKMEGREEYICILMKYWRNLHVDLFVRLWRGARGVPGPS